MKSNNKVKWDVFTLEKEFDCTKGVYLPTSTVIGGDIPFVTAKAGNNGLNGFIGNGTLFDGNCITIEKIRLNAYFQPAPFYCSHDVSVISNDKVDNYNAHFITTMIMRNGEKYSYGRQAQLNVVKREKIMLPITDSKEPDYKYMSEFICEKKNNMLLKYRAYATSRVSALGKHIEVAPLQSKKWLPFLISDIFDIYPGKRLVAADSTQGDRPFIGALDNSNGVARFVSDTNASLDRNVLGVNYNGNGMVIGFYHPYECIFSDDVKRFHLKHHEDNAFVLLFMKVAILQQKSKFGYLYKFNAERMANTRIMLPVTDDGAPDYEYMEQYAKNLMFQKYKQYLAYLDSKEKAAPAAATD